MTQSTYREIKFTDADVVNPDEYSAFTGCDNYKPWLLHDHGFVVAVVFAETEQDALDTAADKGKLDRYKLDERSADVQDEYMHEVEQGKGMQVERDGGRTLWLDYREDGRVQWLGNKCNPYDIESLGIEQLPNPKFSFCALFNHMG